MRQKQGNKGITLVALVITIIVLIILAGVTLSTIIGTNGIISKAQQAKQNMVNASKEENVMLQNLFNEMQELEEGKIPIPEGSLHFGEIIWENGTAKISISTELEGFIIEYQINSKEGEWKELENGGEITGLVSNDIVFARLVKGSSKGEAEKKLIEDKIPPTVTVTAGTTTINEIPVTVSVEDGESGIAEDVEYEYLVGDTSQGTSTESTYTYSNLAGNTEYTLKVRVKDKAGNVGEGMAVARTQIAPPTGWSQINQYTSSGSFTAPETGYFKFAAYAASGSGGSGTVFAYKNESTSGYDGYDEAAGGGSGGCGGYAESQFLLNEGQTISFTFSSGNISCNGINVTAGGNGSSAYKSGGSARAGSGGRAGSASGGNITNVAGKAGSSGGRWHGENNSRCKFNAAKGATNGYCTGGDGPSCDGWQSTGTSATSGNGARLVVYRGNTN